MMSGVIEGAYPKSADAFIFIHMIFIAIFMFSWCGKHAEEHDIIPPNGARLWCGLLALIGVPIYLFKAFGFKQGGLKVLIGIGVLSVTLILYIGSFSLAEFLSRNNFI